MDERPVKLASPFKLQTDFPLVQAAACVVATLREDGHDAFFAGGFVRDRLIGRLIHDVDIATSAHPDRIQKLFVKSHSFGKSFGVIQVEINAFTFEVATFRSDMQYKDGRHPESVTFTSAPEDAKRRDFTVNGLFYDPEKHVVIDYVSGLKDIEKKQIRAIGNPNERFGEDHLRILRAVRFSSVLGFSIEEDTKQAIVSNASKLRSVSSERVRIELLRMFMEAPDPATVLDILRDTNILEIILPEVQRLIGVEQPPQFHPEGDVYTHTRLMLTLMKERSSELIWAILLHDIAKPDTFRVGTDKSGNQRIQFRGHAEQGATMAETIMRRFRCSNEEIEAVHVAVKNHMKFISVPEMRKATLRRWVGSKHFPLELELHRIDCLASHGKLDRYEFVTAFQQNLNEEPVLPPALLNGRDLISKGYKPGPKLGKILKLIYDAQLEGQFSSQSGAFDWLDNFLTQNETNM